MLAYVVVLSNFIQYFDQIMILLELTKYSNSTIFGTIVVDFEIS